MGKTIKILQDKVREQTIKLAQCRKEHGNADLVELRRKIKWCQDTHVRPREFNRPGIFCKQEEPDDQVVASTSRGVKYEPRFKKEQLKSERELKPESNADSSKEYVEY